MDFDPDHPRWHFCCCHLRHALMILAGSETVVSLVVLLLSIIYVAVSNVKEVYNNIPWFVAILILFSIAYGQSSACLFFGVYKYKEYLMYPALTVRAVVFIFSYAIAFSILFQSSRVMDEVNWDNSEELNFQAGTNFIKLLLLIIFILFPISLFIFYTTNLIALCIHYVKTYEELRRMHSMNIPLQIDIAIHQLRTAVFNANIRKPKSEKPDRYNMSIFLSDKTYNCHTVNELNRAVNCISLSSITNRADQGSIDDCELHQKSTNF
ncbi:unnamed protein product [Onchocerca flexuosa]|uniref:Transmembrane protein n=1 Tax=Onchocerca flexuosa TaxID=387005 RepID=A0A183H9T6_9BILA|nr:unnamed protein product [Onchocerca flexuosa]